MSCSTKTSEQSSKKFKGVRQRKWGKWVSEIRVPGSQERLWLGTYATPEAAAVAHDVAFYCLRRPVSLEKLNLPEMLPSCVRQQQQHREMSPRSVQAVASDAGMTVDAQSIVEAAGRNEEKSGEGHDQSDGFWWDGGGDDGGEMCMWQGSEGYDNNHNREGEEEALSISIDDYFLDDEH